MMGFTLNVARRALDQGIRGDINTAKAACQGRDSAFVSLDSFSSPEFLQYFRFNASYCTFFTVGSGSSHSFIYSLSK